MCLCAYLFTMKQGAFLLKLNQTIICISYMFSISNKIGTQRKILLKTLHLDFLELAIIACLNKDTESICNVIQKPTIGSIYLAHFNNNLEINLIFIKGPSLNCPSTIWTLQILTTPGNQKFQGPIL